LRGREALTAADDAGQVAPARMSAPTAPARISAIDGLRGLAVLGILAINVTGFWGPPLASSSPIVPHPEPGAVAWYLAAFVLFEGKMRALFTLLFGASLLLFIDAAERRGASGTWLQVRRLLWLGVFGYLHYLLLWWGDILVTYALCGLVALALRRLQTSGLVAVALLALAGFAALDGGAALVGVAQIPTTSF